MQSPTKEIDLREPRKLNIKPVWNSESKILMVGSITSIDGMKCGYYYSSRYNSFWKLLDFVVLSKKEGYTFDELETLFKTDNEKLFRFSVEEFDEFGLERLEYSEDLHGESNGYETENFMTEYEQKFSSQGNPIYYCKSRFTADSGK